MRLIEGWPHPWMDLTWAELATEYRTLTVELPRLMPILTVIESVIACGMEDRLAASTSLRDLLVTIVPPSEPPIDIIIVRSIISMKPPPPGHVTIEHVATSGHRERITRPNAEVTRLFWRFVFEKYGIRPDAVARRSNDPDPGRSS